MALKIVMPLMNFLNLDSPEWLKIKEATTNPKNKNNECFKYAITVALNHEKIGKTP